MSMFREPTAEEIAACSCVVEGGFVVSAHCALCLSLDIYTTLPCVVRAERQRAAEARVG